MKKIIKAYVGIVNGKNGDTIDVTMEKFSDLNIFAIYPKRKDCLYQKICSVKITIEVDDN